MADLERRSPANVIHAALAEYMAAHKGELSRVFTAAQSAFVAGDLDTLTGILHESSHPLVDDITADIDSYRA